jgi:hypothetical protein
LDVPTAPAIELVRPAPCVDTNKAEEVLRRSLAPALAPRGSWSVIVRFSAKGAVLTVEGEITDEVDAPVAHRIFSETGAECSSLARAVGVWASLVLDAEVDRASQTPPPAPPPPPPLNPLPVALQPVEKPVPEKTFLLSHPEGERTLELGTSTFILGGTGAGVVVGVTLFAVAEVGRGWFLRPAVLVGRTLEEIYPGSDVYATLVAGRFDACGRIPGFYIERHGIQLDVCGGAEFGFQRYDSSSTFSGMSMNPSHSDGVLGVGPSATLRGELGNGLALLIRGVGDFNIFPQSYTESTGKASQQFNGSFAVGRAELGLSWELR